MSGELNQEISRHINYDREDLIIYQESIFIVNDPWLAQDRGFFFSREDAENFADLIRKKNRKSRKRANK